MLDRIRDFFGGSGKQDDRRGQKRRQRRVRSAAKEAPVVDVISQVQCARHHWRAALLGGVIGGAIPWFGRTLAHVELPEAWAEGRTALVLAMLAVILGCCAFSLKTVHKFGRAAFGEAGKATWFVVALEGVMLVSHGATSLWALLLLIGINAVANGCVIALSHEATQRRREADARRAATRAQTRDRRRSAEEVAARAPASWSQPAEPPVVVFRAPERSEQVESPVVVFCAPTSPRRAPASPRRASVPIPPARVARPASPGVAIVHSARLPWDDESFAS